MKPLAVVSVLALLAAQFLRMWMMRTLGDRWTTRVMVVPGEELITAGPYRWLRHPNYLVVVLEIASLPLVHSAWLTAAVFSILNAVLLWYRVGLEEDALQRYSGSNGLNTDQTSGGMTG
jgi:methyltransferase